VSLRVFLADAISLSFCGHDENKAQGQIVCLQIVRLHTSGEPMQACITMGGVGSEAVLADAITSQLSSTRQIMAVLQQMNGGCGLSALNLMDCDDTREVDGAQACRTTW
jgi:hypothetical protein